MVKDPRSGRFFRFGPIEAFILEQLDGARSLHTVRARTEERFGAPLSSTTLDQFARGLHGLELPKRVARRRLRWTIAGCAAICSIFACGCSIPIGSLGKMLGSIRFFFTPYFVSLSALVILAAAGVTEDGPWRSA